MRPEIGTPVFIVVALDRLQVQFELHAAYVIEGKGSALWVKLVYDDRVVIALREQDEGITWCRRGRQQKQACDALVAALALTGPPHQYMLNDEPRDNRCVVLAEWPD